jgi:membrane protease YdiL (CAAX protease family)
MGVRFTKDCSDSMNRFQKPKSRIVAIATAILLPTLVTWVYFHLLADSDEKLQQSAYSIGKAIQFGFPLVWVLLFLRQPIREAMPPADDSVQPWSRATSIQFGIAFGLAVTAMMVAIYWLVFPQSVLENLQIEVESRVNGLGFASSWKYICLGLFYAFFHSFMEEYYFRWFVFGQLRHVTKLVPAMIISGLAFMAHHVIVLDHFFHEFLGLTMFLSLSIATGGIIWAWQYEKSRSLVGPWISHLIVDAGIFAIGYDVLFSKLLR